MSAVKLDKTQRQRPNFPFPDQRRAPDLSAAGPQTDPPPPRARPPATPEAIALAQTVRDHLLEVRGGSSVKRSATGRTLYLERITADTGTVFYHLTDEARAILRDGLCLPWGP